MRRWRFLKFPFKWRLKNLVLFVIVVVFLLVIVPKTGIYDVTLSRLRHSSALLKNEDDLRREKRMFSPSIGEYLLENPYKSDFSRGQSKIIDELLGQKENGFFVDIGAGNGETNSVSLFFERERKWHGVLLEANETKHRWGIIKNRQSRLWNFRIRLDNEVTPDLDNDIRLDRLFQMINRTSIDLLIVNLNGLELELIKNIDFFKYHISVITIELQSDVGKETYLELTGALTLRGYEVVHHVINSFHGKKDVIYLKK